MQEIDPFERLMRQEGVTPLSEKQISARKAHGRPDGHDPAHPAKSGYSDRANQPQAVPVLSTAAHTLYGWAGGSEARKLVNTAIAKLTEERQRGLTGWIMMVRQNGTSVNISPMTQVPQIIAHCDREKIRMVVIGGNGWSAILHPLMGAATLEGDPVGEPFLQSNAPKA